MIVIQIWSKYTGKYHKIDNFHEEIINFDQKFWKISPSGGPLSGRLLKRRAVSDGPLRGGLTVPKKHEILTKHFAVFDHFCPTLAYDHP